MKKKKKLKVQTPHRSSADEDTGSPRVIEPPESTKIKYQEYYVLYAKDQKAFGFSNKLDREKTCQYILKRGLGKCCRATPYAWRTQKIRFSSTHYFLKTENVEKKAQLKTTTAFPGLIKSLLDFIYFLFKEEKAHTPKHPKKKPPHPFAKNYF